MSNPRVLFILKFRSGYGPCNYSETDYSHGHIDSGLFNSAMFVNNMLVGAGVDSKIVEVVDNNDVDREVNAFRPDIVIIEALWIVPEKFDVLIKLYPNIQWIVRCHSDIPFLANESIAIDWILKYITKKEVFVSGNAENAVRDLRDIVHSEHKDWSKHELERKIIYLPNYYPIDSTKVHHPKRVDEFLDVGCFGSIRPMKNQLLQGVVAIEVAEILHKKLRFHINGTRCEQGGVSTLKNLQALFTSAGNELILHPWLNHDDFLELLATMDVGMQVSFSETFNIVAADMIAAGLPIVVSPEIKWTSVWSQADATDSRDIRETMLRVLGPFGSFLKRMNIHNLSEYAHKAKRIWLDEVRHKKH